jgi:hypothetical protein
VDPNDAPSSNGTHKPNQRYPLPTDADCGLLQPPASIGETGAKGTVFTNGPECALLVDPATGRVIGSIAAGAEFTAGCYDDRPEAWRILLPGGGTAEAPLDPGTAALADEGLYNPIEHC